MALRGLLEALDVIGHQGAVVRLMHCTQDLVQMSTLQVATVMIAIALVPSAALVL